MVTIREGLYFANIREQVNSRIHNSRESVLEHFYQIICSNLSVRMFDHWPFNVIENHL